MTDLIDRGELKNRLKWGWTNDKFVLRAIDEMPEAVKHGRWIPVDPDKYDFATEWCCSECDKDVFVTWYGKECDYGYCPNCGAKMDGGEDETELAE